MRRILLTTALAMLVAIPAAAQKLTLEFKDGLVTVDAAAVPVRTILNEWAKLGGTKVVGAERVTGAPLTVKLVDVPEAQALEVVLRSVAGYMAAPRRTGTGASMYDRILVLATSAAPAPAAVNRPSPTTNPMTGTQRFVPPRRPQPAEDEAEAEDEEKEDDPNPPNPPVFTFPQPGQSQPGMFNGPFNSNGQQVITVNPATGTAPANPQPSPTPGYPTTSPFGSSTPGVIIAPPQPQQQPGQPPVIRPPGGER
jgi:hypothetical protein